MGKKHGSVPKIHTCSGPDSRNEQNTGIQGAITNGTPVPSPQVRTTPHDWGGLRSNRRPTDGSSSPALAAATTTPRSGWPNRSSGGLRADVAATLPSPTPMLEGRGQAIKAKEPEAPSADGGGDLAGDEDFSSRHLRTDDGRRLPTGRSPLGSSRTGEHRPPRRGAVPGQRQDNLRTRTPP